MEGKIWGMRLFRRTDAFGYVVEAEDVGQRFESWIECQQRIDTLNEALGLSRDKFGTFNVDFGQCVFVLADYSEDEDENC